MVLKRSGLIIGLVLIAAMYIRFGILGIVRENPERTLRRDSDTYIRVANNLLSGNGFSQQENPPFLPSALRTPIYPLFIALNYAFTGGSIYSLVLVQVLINIITIWLVYQLGRILLSKEEAIVGSLLFAFSSGPLVHAVFILSETVFTFLLLMSVLLVAQYNKSNKRRYLVFAGIISGLAILCRPIGAFFPLLIAATLILADRQRRMGKSVSRALLYLGMCGLIITPWLARNWITMGNPVLSTISGHNLLFYNAASLQADLEGKSQAQVRAESAAMAKAELGQRGWDGNEALESRLYTDWGRAIILQHPFRYIAIHTKNNLNSLLPDVTDYLELAGVTQGGKGTLSVLNQYGLWAAINHYFAGRTELLWIVAPWIMLLGITYLGAVLGIVVLVVRKSFPPLTLLILPIIYFLILPGAASNPRFRIPVMPYFCLLAGVGIYSLYFNLYAAFKRNRMVSVS